MIIFQKPIITIEIMATAIVIGDEPNSTNSLAQSLAVQGGINVIGKAHDGERGFQLFSQLKPWVTVLDFRTPDVNSRYAIDMIKEKNSDAKIVMITSPTNYKFGKNKIDALFYKPYNLTVVVETIKKLAHS